MPLTEIVRHLNDQTTHLPANHLARDPLVVAGDGRVFVAVAGLRLESEFVPVYGAGGKIYGHSAVLRTFAAAGGQAIAADAAFVLPTDDQEFITLDRLVRTLHALNYLTRLDRSALLLKVHRRHVLSVSGEHGLAFEEILRTCGLFPEQVTLEIDADGIDDRDRFARAIHSYRGRGYGIALSGFGRTAIDFAFVEALAPDLVRFDPLLLASPRPLDRLVTRILDLGARVIVEAGDGEGRSRRIEVVERRLPPAQRPAVLRRERPRRSGRLPLRPSLAAG